MLALYDARYLTNDYALIYSEAIQMNGQDLSSSLTLLLPISWLEYPRVNLGQLQSCPKKIHVTCSIEKSQKEKN